MLSWFLIIVGSFIIGMMLIDVLWSTLSTNGGGPIAMRVTQLCWKVARALFVRFSYHRILEFNSVAILVITFSMWVTSMWLGWTIIFSSYEGIVVHEATGHAASAADRAYFAGMTFLTLGTGDFIAQGSAWRLVSLATSINGLVIVTLTLTYLISVVSAAIEKRQLAATIHSTGRSASEILTNSWNGHNFDALVEPLHQIASQLTLHAESHLAYPVLQYFHPTDEEVALPPALASLDDAVTILKRCVSEDCRPSQTILATLRQAIDLYIYRIQLPHISSDDTEPPLPDLEALKAAGIPFCDENACKDAFAGRAELRHDLKGLITAEGWTWPQDKTPSPDSADSA